MRKTREILRQKWELGRTHRATASSLGTSAGAVGAVIARASAAGLSTWPEVEVEAITTKRGVLIAGQLSMIGRNFGQESTNVWSSVTIATRRFRMIASIPTSVWISLVSRATVHRAIRRSWGE